MPFQNHFPGAFLLAFLTPDQLDEMLPKVGGVCITAPLTPEIEDLIGSNQFDLMKRGAYFIAVSRRRLEDKGALSKAGDSQHLAGAGLGVTDL